MDFEEAKEILIANSVGSNEYHQLQTWSELASAADFECQCAQDRLRQLAKVESAACGASQENHLKSSL
ncbi:hypothetical protein L5M28_23305 [Shewanella sp. SW32]|uniref:hypothetical protein n=1 Tax=unclassified Shewanella TaxID=196818 RepID=UPI0021DA9097|nr:MULTISPECIES: hypothetical protein [unclassified Shewanella]MCU7965472.1 hypothetical protein [Shewanella sp. SW32]MCU7973521.1 hypothetical protein [Shewanella sp. SW29]MCU8045584.1 hypothetical protein [Shewanella sp. SM68]MCU8049895.1 hypothetical protein [Shewanella sp. SM65]